MAPRKENVGRKVAARSRILREITIMLVLVMLASGLAVFFIVRASQERLIEKSVDRFLAQNAEDVFSFFLYTTQRMLPEYMELVQREGVAKIAVAVLGQQLSESQRYICDDLSRLAEARPMGVELHMIVVLSSMDFPVPDPIIFACNDEGLIYHWEIPEDVLESLEGGGSYVFRENGVPELGLEGEYLFVTARIEDPEAGYVAGYVGLKPLAGEMAAINRFYDRERRNTLLTLGMVVGISVLAVIFVSFFILNLLIRRRITRPIEQLTEAAEKVMEGELDTEIVVHEGGDFSVLERAFREMLGSIRRMFEAATKGE